MAGPILVDTDFREKSSYKLILGVGIDVMCGKGAQKVREWIIFQQLHIQCSEFFPGKELRSQARFFD